MHVLNDRIRDNSVENCSILAMEVRESQKNNIII